jgi:hypothetical protein
MKLPDSLTDLLSVEPGMLADDELMNGQRELARAREWIERREAAFAAEVAYRSRRELGHSGLAARHGARSAERLVQELTGASGAASRRLVRVGSLVATATGATPATAATPAEPWLRPALTAGLAIEAVDVIRAGLGMHGAAVTAEQLTAAAAELAAVAATLPVDELAARARELRDDLDAEGVALRERELRDQRYLRRYVRRDGMTKLDGLLDPVSDATLLAALDGATAPRRTPSFVSDDDLEAEALIPDDRSTEQRALDALIELVDVGVRHPNTTLLGPRRPAVRLLVTLSDLESQTGFGYLEGSGARVSLDTVERHICTSGTQPILFDSTGQAMDVGREQRLHNGKQREAITTRDGGCLIPGCDRPPSWAEIHHIIPWAEGGGTSVEDAVCLCRYHHMMVHNNDWRITREGADYFLVPPASNDPNPVPRPIRKSAPIRRLLAQAG